MNVASGSYGRRVFWYFVLFFVTLIAIDGAMATLAIRTQTGLVTAHPYEQGVAYNKVVAAAEAQDKLGWKGEIAFSHGTLTFLLHDAAAHPLAAEQVTAQFYRPTQAGMDFTLTLKAGAKGEFTASPVFPAKGMWDVRVLARYEGKHYQLPHRIVVE